MRNPGPVRLFVGMLVGSSIVATSAHAQDRVSSTNGEGMDVHLFRPAIDSKGFFSVNGAGVLGAGSISFGLVTVYGHRPMRLAPNHGAPALVESSFQGTFHFNYGLGDWAVVGFAVPVNLMSGEAVTQVGPAGSAYDSGQLNAQGFGSPSLHAKAQILSPERGFGLALLLQGGMSVSESMQRNLGSDEAFYWPQLIAEMRFGDGGRFRLGANVGYRGHTQENPRFDQLRGGPGFQYGNLLTAGLGASYRASDTLDLVAESYLTQVVGAGSGAKQALSNEVVGGLKVFVERNSYLLLGGGTRTTPGFQAADARAFIGFIFEPSIADSDRDGIPDNEDACPLDPEDFDGDRDEDGCPDLGGERLLANRKAEDGDRDRDGIPDSIDRCPDDPEDRDGFEDDDGCPDPDNDGDRIPDVEDACPNEREVYNGFQDEDGCPDEGKIVIEDNTIVLNEKISFKTNSAEILAESDALLDAMAKALLAHPEFLLIEVQGHADERAPDLHNLRLTQKRASAVVDALVKRGVAPERLRPMGYGEYCPIDASSNQEAWERNRRVELKVVRTTSGPTGVVLGCERAREKGVVSPLEP